MVLPQQLNETLANVLNSHLRATDKSYPVAASVRKVENRSCNLVRSYPEVVNHLLKKFGTDHVNAEFEAAISLYIQPANITPQKYADHLAAKLCRGADVYDEDTLNDEFIEKFDSPIRHSLRHYWTQNPQADLTDITFQPG